MRNNFKCNSFVSALGTAIDDMAKRRVDLTRRHILIVPDRCTLTAERALCDKTGGAFDAYVTTWSRLTGEREGEYLPRKGSVMLVRSILEACHGQLSCYSRSWAAKGFASRMYDVISQLSVCGITPEQLITEDDGGKSADIALVYGEYLKATAGELTDASGRMILLARTLERTDFLTNATVYVACFDSYTPLMERVMNVIEQKALELRVYDAEADESSRLFGDVELYSAPASASAAKAIAARIASERRRGVPYDEMCVVTAAVHPDEIVRIFRENGIPYCATGSLTLAEHPLGKFITGVIDCMSRGYRAEDVVRLAKNPCTGTEKRDCDAFERFVVRRGITYRRFFEQFEGGAGEEYREGAERVRQSVADILTAAENCDTAAEMLECVIDCAEACYPEYLSEADEGRASPAAKARELAALCGRLLGDVSKETALDAFCEGMRETELSVRPRLRGAVGIGGERDFRARRFSRVYVADFDSDTHPAVTGDDGLISDREIAALRERGTPLSPTTAEVNRRAADEFFYLLSGAEKVMLVYSEKAGDVLDVVVRGCKRNGKRFTEKSWARETALLGASSNPFDLAVYCPTENMLCETYLSALSESRESGDEPAWMDYTRKLCAGAEKWMMPQPLSVSATAGKLMTGSTTTATRLETYFTCPRKHYYRYALGVTVPEEAELSALDIGNMIHSVAERYVSEAFGQPPYAAAKRLLTEAIASTEKSEEDNKRMMRLLLGEAAGLCGGIKAQIEAGSFRPVGEEVRIGPGCEYAGPEFDANGRRVMLSGKIDRIDGYGDLVRLIDYKTGYASCKLGEVRMGVKLQLLLYLAAMRLKGYRPAGAFYMPTRCDFTTEKPYLLSGFCVNSSEVLDAMDPRILSERDSDIIEVKGKRGKTAPPKVCNGESGSDLGGLIDYALGVAGEAAGEIADGYIRPSPYADGSSVTACVRCEFAGCCPHERGARKSATPELSFGGKDER